MKRLLFLFITSQLISCVSDKDEGVVVSDATLFSLSQSVSSFTYYKNNDDTLVTDPTSEHGLFMRVRFNPKALSAMTDSVSGLRESDFPDESMVVKEVYYQRGGPLIEYVIMYKLRHASNNSYGWLWSQHNPDGSVIYTSAKKGDRCVSCHTTPVNNDLVRTFSLHP